MPPFVSPAHGFGGTVELAMVRIVVLVMLARVAAAQPVTHTDECMVDVLAALDEVRAAIEAWVRAEPRCDKYLEVTVTAQADGLRLWARDDTGRVRERIAPDAQSVAVLVVSWMANDSLPDSAPAGRAMVPAMH